MTIDSGHTDPEGDGISHHEEQRTVMDQEEPQDNGQLGADPWPPDTGMDDDGLTPEDDEDDAPKPPPRMGLLEWVEQVFAPMIQRRVELGRGQTWCARWWAHPEVAVRLNALRCAWYELSAPAEPGGEPGAAYSSWWVNHVDPTLMTILNGDTGPMSGCRPDRHSATPVPPLPTERPPGRNEQR